MKKLGRFLRSWLPAIGFGIGVYVTLNVYDILVVPMQEHQVALKVVSVVATIVALAVCMISAGMELDG